MRLLREEVNRRVDPRPEDTRLRIQANAKQGVSTGRCGAKPAKVVLASLHCFGSPEMVFFGGITHRGAELLRAAQAQSARSQFGSRTPHLRRVVGLQP